MTTTTDPTALLGKVLLSLQTVPDPTEGTLEDVARCLDIAEQAQYILAEVIHDLRMDIAERMESDTQVIAGIGQFTRRPIESSVWKDETSRDRMFDDAKRAIAQKVARDPMTGELLQPLVMVARETFDLMEQVFSLGAQPKTAFKKALGLQPDEYRTKSRSGYTVKIDRGIKDTFTASNADLPEPF